jgi:type IV pilus assembly protein PilM
MFRLTRSQLQPIGIDIGHDSIKMLQLEVVGQSLEVRAACRRPLPLEARAQKELRLPLAVELVRQMLRQGRFSGRSAAVALPRSIVHMKNFRLPLMPAADLEAAVQIEARQLFQMDVEDATVRFLPAGEVRQGDDVLQEVIVLAARNEDVNNFVEQLHRCGLAVNSVDIEACALFRSVERFIRRRQDELEVHVLVDVGHTGTQVVIGKGRDLSFIKSIDIGGQHLHEAVARKLGVLPDEAVALRRRLVESVRAPGASEARDSVRQAVFDATRMVMEPLGREISLCLRYQSVTFRGHRPTRLRLMGGEARDPQLQNVLASIIPIPVEVGRPLFSVDTSAMSPTDGQGDMSEWAIALGLGLRRTAGRFAPRDGRSRGAAPLPEMDEDAECPTEGAAPAASAAVVPAQPMEATHA